MQPITKRYEPQSNHDATHSSRTDTVVHDALDSFTKEENQLYKLLSKTQHDSIWGEAIRLCVKEVRKTGDIRRFKKLIVELKSQAKDCADTMEMIVGKEGLKMIMEL